TSQILATLPVERVLICPHDNEDGCSCRKPKPGLLFQAASETGADLSGSFMVGDTWRDMRAGQEAGCTTILVRRPYNADVSANHVVADLDEAAAIILRSAVS
ncbi:MAG: HAD-IIIA family hydrolase, partial [Nitrospira sp.]